MTNLVSPASQAVAYLAISHDAAIVNGDNTPVTAIYNFDLNHIIETVEAWCLGNVPNFTGFAEGRERYLSIRGVTESGAAHIIQVDTVTKQLGIMTTNGKEQTFKSLLSARLPYGTVPLGRQSIGDTTERIVGFKVRVESRPVEWHSGR